MQCRKNIKAESNKKRMNIANFIDIYTYIYIYLNIYIIYIYNMYNIYIYIPVLYVMIMTQNKSDSINSILQHRRFAYKNC